MMEIDFIFIDVKSSVGAAVCVSVLSPFLSPQDKISAVRLQCLI